MSSCVNCGTPTPAFYTLSLHDALPIWQTNNRGGEPCQLNVFNSRALKATNSPPRLICLTRSEEHTSELQSHANLVCSHLHENKTSGVHRRSDADAVSSRQLRFQLTQRL